MTPETREKISERLVAAAESLRPEEDHTERDPASALRLHLVTSQDCDLRTASGRHQLAMAEIAAAQLQWDLHSHRDDPGAPQASAEKVNASLTALTTAAESKTAFPTERIAEALQFPGRERSSQRLHPPDHPGAGP